MEPQGPPKHEVQTKQHEPATETGVAGGVGGETRIALGQEQVGAGRRFSGILLDSQET